MSYHETTRQVYREAAAAPKPVLYACAVSS